MKKILCLLLVALMMFSLAACGDKTPDDSNDTNISNDAQMQAFAVAIEALGKLDVDTLAQYVSNEGELKPVQDILADETTKEIWLAMYGKVKYLGTEDWFAYQHNNTTMFAGWYTDLLVNGKEIPDSTSKLTKDELLAVFSAHKDSLSYTNVHLYPGDSVWTEGDKVFVDLQKLCNILTGNDLNALVPKENSTAPLEQLLFGHYSGSTKVNTLNSEVYTPFKEFVTLDLTKVADVVARLDYDFEAKIPNSEYDKEYATYMTHAAVYQKYYKDTEFVVKLQQFIETAKVEIFYANDHVFLKWEGKGMNTKENLAQLNEINGNPTIHMLGSNTRVGTADYEIADFYLYKALVDAYLMETAN